MNLTKKAFVFVLGLTLSLFVGSAMAKEYKGANEKKFQINTNPIALLFGVYSIKLDTKVAKEWTVGLDAGYLNYSLSSNDSSLGHKARLKAFTIGANATYYFSGDTFTDSWILTPGINYSSASASLGNSKADISAIALSALGGYHWQWENGFNLELGAGLAYYIQGKSEFSLKDENDELKFENRQSGIAPILEFNIGYSF